MGFSMFSTQASPIAIDFGSTAVKLLQVSPGDEPHIVAAAELPVPDTIRLDNEKLLSFYAEWLPKTIASGGFKGKRVVIAIPAGQTFTQHMQLAHVDGVNRDDLIKGQLNQQIGCMPDSVVVRSVDVATVHRQGQQREEIICFAMARDTVMRYIEIMRRCRLKVAGVHTEMMAMTSAFDHLCRRAEDEQVTTMYVDLGWAGTRVAICHGHDLMFARSIQIGGRHFDQLIASELNCAITDARAHRLTLHQPMPARADGMTPDGDGMALMNAAARAHAADDGAQAEETANSTATADDRRVGQVPAEFCAEVTPGPVSADVRVDMTELLDTVADELSMCLRYHKGLFPSRPIDRVIFLGGEARQLWLCQHIINSLRLPAQLGDPLARLSRDRYRKAADLNFDQPQPGWAVSCGLCTAPTDL
jgi:Tfp pilus assembly PilM family ATPase